MSREIPEGALYYLERGCDTEDEDTGKKFCENNSCIGGIPCAWNWIWIWNCPAESRIWNCVGAAYEYFDLCRFHAVCGNQSDFCRCGMDYDCPDYDYGKCQTFVLRYIDD